MMILINYAEYYVEIYVLPYTVMFGGVLKRWEEPFLAVTIAGGGVLKSGIIDFIVGFSTVKQIHHTI